MNGSAARTVGIRVSTEGADRARRELEQFGVAGEAALRRVEVASLAASPGLQRLAGASDVATRAFQGMGGSLGTVGSTFAGVSVAAGGLTAGIVAMGAAAVAAGVQIAKAGDTATAVLARLASATGSASAAERAFEGLFRLSQQTGIAVADSAGAFWPAVYLPEDLEWEDDNWWEGQITAAEAEGYPIALEHDVGSNIRARYWRIAFTDLANSAGYIELARLWMGPIWSPQRNLSYGAGLTWEARSIAEYSLGGVLFSEPRPPARVLRLTLNALNDVEAYGTILDAQRRVGTDGEVWVIPNWDDAARRFKRDFLARFRRFDPITQVHNRLWAGADPTGLRTAPRERQRGPCPRPCYVRGWFRRGCRQADRRLASELRPYRHASWPHCLACRASRA